MFTPLQMLRMGPAYWRELAGLADKLLSFLEYNQGDQPSDPQVDDPDDDVPF